MISALSKTTLFIVLAAAVGCGPKSNTVRDAARESLSVNQPPPTAPTAPVTQINSATASLVQHYICPNNCPGSGGPNPGTCPVCGSEYVHNQAYHDQQQATQATGGERELKTMTFEGNTTPDPNAPPPPPAEPPPAQNAAGEWHYICPNGDEGGSAVAGTCPKCGSALVHNARYHQ